jgi:hypothetical protein
MSAPYLRLVASYESGCVADSNALFAVFCELKDLWHRTKIEANRQRAMRAYNAWIFCAFPKEQQEPLLLRSTSTWGFN